MFIWRGFGVAVVGLTFVMLLLTELGVERAFSDDSYYQDHGWPKLFAFVLAAGLVWVLSSYFESRPPRLVVDQKTGETLVLMNRHDLFFIPLKYWPAILIVLGVAIMIFG